jgi:hypothetical protein
MSQELPQTFRKYTTKFWSCFIFSSFVQRILFLDWASDKRRILQSNARNVSYVVI